VDKLGAECILKRLSRIFVIKPWHTALFHQQVANPVPHFQTDKTNEEGQKASVSSTFHCNNDQVLSTIVNNMSIHEDFISESEEKSLLMELEPYLKRLRYEFSHWDDAIHGFRETEKSNWNVENKAILQRVCNLAFNPQQTKPLKHVHVLDISKEGYIKPHVDSIRFCGDTIAGLSLLSSSVMRLICENDKEKFVDVFLKQRSLYIMKGEARFKYTHEILADSLSFFNGVYVPRDRRISVICRNEPLEIDQPSN